MTRAQRLKIATGYMECERIIGEITRQRDALRDELKSLVSFVEDDPVSRRVFTRNIRNAKAAIKTNGGRTI